MIDLLPVGSPATGDDFIDRERETAFILSTIEKDHIMLVALRRVEILLKDAPGLVEDLLCQRRVM